VLEQIVRSNGQVIGIVIVDHYRGAIGH
jgi:hypothetical protein